MSVHVMKRSLLFMLLLSSLALKAQKVDSIFFNLYTDSLKKGSWNYINVDALLDNGKYIPLNHEDLIINTTGGTVKGSSIWLEWDFKQAFITVEVMLKVEPSVKRSMTIWVKKQDLQMNAPVQDSLLQQINNRNKKPASSRRKKN